MMTMRDEPAAPKKPSYGNMSDEHWSRARAGENEEALEYYRERSKAPGVAEGGSTRNHYCMKCDGVIPFEHEGETCPHCGTPIDGTARRYFNWVEINEPPKSDARALLVLLAIGAAGLLALASVVAWMWMRARGSS